MGEQERSRWEQQLRDAARHVEEDLRRVVTYINDEVVPDVRQNSTQALRFAARELEKLAQKMDDRKTASAEAPPPPQEK
jgi:glutamyl-tRNA reductase